jgi:hypothetical protein
VALIWLVPDPRIEHRVTNGKEKHGKDAGPG